MAINLDEKALFSQYREAKDLSIERLLRQYGTSLSDMREMYPQLTENIKARQLTTALPTQALFFTPSEALQMGLSLQEGWMLKMTPEGEGYTSSLITPLKWELTENDLYISPTGEKYSKADLEALLAPPSGIGEGITGIPTVENLNEEGQRLYQEYQATGGQLDVAGWLDLRENQQLETEQVFGAVFPQQDIDEVMAYIQENPEGFLADIREIGPSQEVITLLKSLEFQDEQGNAIHLTDQEIQGFFVTGPEYIPESKWKDTKDALLAGAMRTIQGIETFLFTNPPPDPSNLEAYTAWATHTTAIAPQWLPQYAQSKYEQALQQTIDGYLRRRQANDQYWAEHPELAPRPAYLEDPFKNPSLFLDPGYWGYNIANSLAYSLAIMGTMAVVSAVATPFVGVPAGLALASMPEAGQMIDELVDKGVPLEQAVGPAQWYGLAAGGIETASDLPLLGLIFKPFKAAIQPVWNTILRGFRNIVVKSVVAGVVTSQTEGLEEGLTQVVHNAILKHYVPMQSLWEGVSQSYIQGVIASMPFAGIGGYSSFRTFRSSLSKETGEKFDNLVTDLQGKGLTEEQAQVQAVNELAREPAMETDLSKAIETAQLEYYKEHPEVERPTMEPVIPNLPESILQDMKVAQEMTRKVIPVTPEATKLTAQLDKIEGIEKTYWKPETASLTVYYDETIDKDTANTRVQKYLAENALRDSVEKITFISTAKGTFAIPQAELGMPEAGLQAGIPGMAAAEPVRPQPTGRLVQARMDDYLRLRDYNAKATTDRIAEIKKALEKKGRTELGLRGTLALELARLEALQEVDAIESIEDLDSLIREVENELGARSMPGRGLGGRTGIKRARHPGFANLFPGYTIRQLDEMRNVYLQARETMQPQVPELKPTPVPEPTPAQVNKVKTDPTPASDEIILKKFIECIKDAKPATEETLALRHKELQKRSAIFASILQGGEGYHAFEQAKSALKGPLPKADWDLDLQKFGITDAEITRMFDRIRLDDKLQPFQKLNTYEALTNLLSGATLTEGEINSLEKVFGSRLAVALIGKLPTGKRVVRILQDITNVPRTLVTIADLSATFRQGALLAFGQPVQFSEAFVAQLKAVFSEKNFRLIDEINHNNPYVASGKLKRLYIAPIGEAVTIEAREEAFRGRLIERVPVLGSIIRASERAYITFLNVLRVSVATYYARQWEGTGKTANDYDKLCDFINHATGRGDLGSFTQAGSWLSAIFFSPRFIMSRVQVPLDLINTTPAVRKVIARNLVAFVGTGMLALFLARLAGAETEDDPRSADFGKIKIGNTRIDFWGGYLPYVRLITQIITEERKSTKTGEVYKIIDPIDVGVNFFRSKLAPVPGFLWDLKSGSTFIGEELTAENAEKIIFEKLTPMFIQDLIEAVKDTGIAGVGYGLLSALGVGIQTYSDNWETAELKLGLPQRGDNFPYTIENEIYDVKDYYSEISDMLQIGTGVGATYEMLSGKKNIPPLVLSVAQARDVVQQINLLPNKRLTNINADPTKGDTFEQYRTQWLAREKITDSEELKQFDKDYPDAYLGNITQAQYALLVEYHSLPEDEKADFLGRHPELYINPREEWLRTHPAENALLSLWGKADIYSPEAVGKVTALRNSLGIPENALVMEDLDAVTELKLKNQSLFDLLEAYGGLDDTLKGPDGLTARDRAVQQLYADNPDFRDDQRRIEALNVGTVTNPTIESMVEGWVERGQIADDFGSSSAEMKLWLIDNKEVHQWALDNALLTDTGEDWNENILRLQVSYREDFGKYEDYGDTDSPLYISNDTARGDAREAMLFDNRGMTSFGTAYYTINALQKDIPENLVPDYVEYYGIRKQEGVDYSAGWYEDDWFLIENKAFYETMLSLGLWQERDFTKVPTRQVYSLYKAYMNLPTGEPRLDFRRQHLDLDAWLVLAKGLTPIGDR